MSITTIKGNLLTSEGYIIHGCNTQGVMGAGVALAIKEMYPHAYHVYRAMFDNCLQERPGLGSISTAKVSDTRVIINAITQDKTGRDKDVVYVSYDGVRASMRKANSLLKHNPAGLDNPRLNFPLIGCGLANGDWDIIKAIIEEEITSAETFLYIL